jgi:hypothetical protein
LATETNSFTQRETAQLQVPMGTHNNLRAMDRDLPVEIDAHGIEDLVARDLSTRIGYLNHKDPLHSTKLRHDPIFNNLH